MHAAEPISVNHPMACGCTRIIAEYAL